MIKNEKYKVEGMSCAACQARVEKAVNSLNGVKACSVSLLTNSMIIDREESLDISDVENVVKKAGYKAKLLKNKEDTLLQKNNETKKLLIILIVSFVFLIPLFYLSMGYMNGWYIFSLENYPLIVSIIELVLATIIVGLNYRFFVSGIKAIFHGGPNMDTLVSLGSGVAYIYSLIIFILMIVNKDNSGELMRLSMNTTFETAGMVPTLITVGKLLESISKGKTTNAIKSLIKLRPNTAHKYEDGNTINIPSENLKIGDLFMVKPGELFPVDGIISQGYSTIDESSLTGESLPLDKKENDLIKSGTINLTSTLIVKATAVGEDTTISKIIKMVEDASTTKAKISRLADRISLVFVPSVIGISLITFIVWMFIGNQFVASHNLEMTGLSYALSRAISVLVISCPCALGLATPVSIMVGTGKGAKNGILFKNAQTLEETGKVDIVIFDKTGTLTKGKTKVVSYFGEQEALVYAYSLEKLSNHPYGKAICEYSSNKQIKSFPCKDFKEISGIGLEGTIEGKKVLIVKESLIKEKGFSNSFMNEFTSIKGKGLTPIGIVVNNRVIGVLALGDELRSDAIDIITSLNKLGITTVMLSGDNESTARAIAKQIGLKHVYANLLPNQKYEVIKELQKQGKVMMVGDGINDSVALTQADIGIAIGKGSDIAIESADIVLAKDSLMDIYAATRLSKRTILNIKENLVWAFVYNLVMIPIAAGVFSGLGLYKLAPWMGSMAMALSSVTVVVNALRLNLTRIYKQPKNKKKQRIIYVEPISKGEKGNMKVYVEGMMCEHCVNRVKNALLKIDGISEATVTLKTGVAELKTSKDIKDDLIKTAIENDGYKVAKIVR